MVPDLQLRYSDSSKETIVSEIAAMVVTRSIIAKHNVAFLSIHTNIV